jgi:hypothetical protein
VIDKNILKDILDIEEEEDKKQKENKNLHENPHENQQPPAPTEPFVFEENKEDDSEQMYICKMDC